MCKRQHKVSQMGAFRLDSWFRSNWVAFLVALVSLVAYISTLAPGLSWAHSGADGGDLITAAYHLGVPHPPGYPLYVLVAHVWNSLLSWLPDIAQRFNLFSAFCAAAAAGLMTMALGRKYSPLAGAVAGLSFAFGPTLWSQAVISEVYALQALMIACVLAASVGSSSYRPNSMGLAMGLACSAHLGSFLLFPLVAWRVGRAARARSPRDVCESILRGAGYWAAGMGIYLVLPLLAARQPVVNWGDVTSASRWWWLVSARLYHGYVFGLDPTLWGERVVIFARLAFQHLTVPGIIVMLVGAGAMLLHQRGMAAALLVSMISYLLFALGYDTADSYVLLIPLWQMGIIFLAAGLAHLEEVTEGHRRAMLRLMVLLPPFLLLNHWSDISLRSSQDGKHLQEQLVQNVPKNALVITQDDASTFALWYYQHVVGIRPDMRCVDKDMESQPWYQAMLRAQYGQDDWASDTMRPVCRLDQEQLLSCND